MAKIKIGQKVKGIKFESSKYGDLHYAGSMDECIDRHGEIVSKLDDRFQVQFKNEDGTTFNSWWYPNELHSEMLIKKDKPKIGKKVCGVEYDFRSDDDCTFVSTMEKLIGVVGTIEHCEKGDGRILVRFPDRATWYYPVRCYEEMRAAYKASKSVEIAHEDKDEPDESVKILPIVENRPAIREEVVGCAFKSRDGHDITYNPEMDAVVGKKGIVQAIGSTYFRVHFGASTWSYPFEVYEQMRIKEDVIVSTECGNKVAEDIVKPEDVQEPMKKGDWVILPARCDKTEDNYGWGYLMSKKAGKIVQIDSIDIQDDRADVDGYVYHPDDLRRATPEEIARTVGLVDSPEEIEDTEESDGYKIQVYAIVNTLTKEIVKIVNGNRNEARIQLKYHKGFDKNHKIAKLGIDKFVR